MASQYRYKSQIAPKSYIDPTPDNLVTLKSPSHDHSLNDRSYSAILPELNLEQNNTLVKNLINFSEHQNKKVDQSSLSKVYSNKVILETTQKKILDMIDFIHSISIFSKWQKVELSKVLYLFKIKNFNKGQYIFKQNDSPSHVYFISKGTFTITKNVIKQVYDKSPVSNNQILKKFDSKNIKRLIKVDLVVKGEKEILGAEEVVNSSKGRHFSCICSSAVAEVYVVTANEFLNKLLRNNVIGEYTQTLKMDFEWLSFRSQNLEGSSFLMKSFDQISLDKKNYSKEPKKPKIKLRSKEVLVYAKSEKSLTQFPESHKRKDNKLASLTVNWASQESVNIHMAKVKRGDKRLAPPNFLLNLRMKLGKKPLNQDPES
ncbi:hypothetical protein SteCoe_8852 [Stentor coeruleus]|uniref:Cyclic nucleotide-binding domain-containing protein n=1 Tax=Stentor coeruleus TaxID=5963 RepID=A0A1R2CJ59_9CILI|nr:hypothetical protein SteCoe_8852 [Stentor coeruleus]